MSNSLDLDEDRPFVGPDLGPNCLQRLSADDKSRRLWSLDILYLSYMYSYLMVLIFAACANLNDSGECVCLHRLV